MKCEDRQVPAGSRKLAAGLSPIRSQGKFLVHPMMFLPFYDCFS